ncbi:hypothetical protein BDV96DRAFT_627806 [Lophiotrema nucula]|uniref:Uncharacterized protein n=1 Tax=Lophiotrema nucula TaxID=690887 RepID=A0A6A5ZPU2_9PLEO|nr:hypothetical protein BDV96DRAFT_627806 [Lophiotrema nucula]
MALEENFYGNHLRLSAFLRVVDGAPQRPSRCRRRGVPPAEDSHRHDFDHTLNKAQALTSSIDEAASSLPRFESSQNQQCLPLTDDDSNFAHGSPVQDLNQENGGVSKENRTVVRKCNAKKTRNKAKDGSSSGGNPGTRRRHRHLPVNELTLVRTSTEDGLPARSEEDATHNIMEADPIEDSQQGVSIPRSGRFHPGSVQPRPTLPSKSIITTKLILESNSKRRGPITASPMFSARALSDGFNGAELSTISLPLRARPTRGVTKKKKERVTVPVHCRLDLVTGELPATMLEDVLLSPGLGRLSARSEIPHGVIRSDGTMRSSEIESHSAHLRRTATDPIVYTQLASISAPTRNDGTSESSSDEGEEEQEDSSDRDSDLDEDLEYFSGDDVGHHEVDCPENSRELQTRARIHFEASKIQLNIMAGVDEDFWAHYGDLEG